VQLQFRKSPHCRLQTRRGHLQAVRDHDQLVRGHGKVHRVGRKMCDQGRESDCQSLHVKRRYVYAWCRSTSSEQELEKVQSRTLEIRGLIVHILNRVECAEMHGQRADSRPGCEESPRLELESLRLRLECSRSQEEIDRLEQEVDRLEQEFGRPKRESSQLELASPQLKLESLRLGLESLQWETV
jgi:hypothetical protein